jgi:hypothetical protein
MNGFTKGAIVMSGLLSQALGALFKENEQIVAPAKALAGVASCRISFKESATDLATGEKKYRWCIEFQNGEDCMVFDEAVRHIIDAVTGEEQ